MAANPKCDTCRGDWMVCADTESCAKHPFVVDNQLIPSKALPKFDGNTKDDSAKVAVSRGVLQYFPRALRHVAIISQGGAKKYDWEGWREVPEAIARYRDALGRHELKHNEGEVFDPDHSRYCIEPVRHLGQVAWNALAVLELILEEEEKGNE